MTYTWDDLNQANIAVSKAIERADHISAELGVADKTNVLEAQTMTVKHSRGERRAGKYVIPGLIRENTISIFFGRPGKHKSSVVMDMAMCMADGIRWPGTGWKPEAPINVLWIDQDAGRENVQDRVAASSRGRGVSVDNDNFHILSYPEPEIDLGKPAVIEQLTEMIKKRKYKLVIFDTLKSVSGGAEENSDEMHHIIKGLRKIANHTGCAIVIIHHSRKNGPEELRGSTTIEGAVDATYRVTVEDELVVIEQIKARFNRLSSPIKLKYVYRHTIGTEDLAEYYYEGEQHAEEVDKNEAKLLKIITAEPGITKDGMVKITKFNHARMSVLIKSLMAKGLIIVKEEKRQGMPRKRYHPAQSNAQKLAEQFKADLVEVK